jgi:hypothetical protein
MAEYTSKVVLGTGEVLIDLTADTVDAAHLLNGYTAHGADGAPITGTCDYDSDTSADTLTAAEAITGKTFHARGTAYTGTMPNNGAVTGTITTVAGAYTIPAGYHDGSGTVSIDSTDQAKIIADNIKDGVSILGVTGTYTGEGVTAQAKTATPGYTQQTILPDTGYDYLSQVTVEAISVVRTENAAGGYTVTIG